MSDSDRNESRFSFCFPIWAPLQLPNSQQLPAAPQQLPSSSPATPQQLPNSSPTANSSPVAPDSCSAAPQQPLCNSPTANTSPATPQRFPNDASEHLIRELAANVEVLLHDAVSAAFHAGLQPCRKTTTQTINVVVGVDGCRYVAQPRPVLLNMTAHHLNERRPVA